MFKPVTSKVSFPEMEEETLRFWKERDIFHKTRSFDWDGFGSHWFRRDLRVLDPGSDPFLAFQRLIEGI